MVEPFLIEAEPVDLIGGVHLLAARLPMGVEVLWVVAGMWALMAVLTVATVVTDKRDR